MNKELLHGGGMFTVGCAVTWTLNCVKVGSAATGGKERVRWNK